MGRRERQRSKLDREAVEEADRIGARSTASAATPSIHIISSDDDEANEDLSLRIVEKALLMRATRLVRDDNTFAGDDRGGVVSFDRAGTDGGAREVEKKGRSTNKVVVKIKKVVKKKKKEITSQKVLVTDEEKEDKKPETTLEIVPEPNPVENSDNAVLRKLLRGPRYFDPPDSSWGACYNCGESGHVAVDCTSARRKKPCFVCGSFEHNVKQCTKGLDCFICKKMGHRARDCPEKYKSFSIDSRICLKCGDSGHDMFSCRYDYYADDFKEVSCYVCKKLGHLCCAEFYNSCPKVVSCYRCGQLGHTGLSCNRLNGETTFTDSASSCYKCGEEGHFARECPNSSKNTKRVREPYTPKFSRSEREPKPIDKGHKSAPHDLAKSPKKKKPHHKENGNTTPKKPKHRGGWVTEDPRDYSYDRSRNSGHSNGYFTPGGHVQTPRSSSRHSRYGSKTPHFHAQPPPNSLYHHNGADSGSRFDYHGSGSSNGWNHRSHGW